MTDAAERLSESEMSLGDHLEELRRRLIRSLFATFAIFFVVFYFHQGVFKIVAAPYVQVASELRMSAVLNNIRVTGTFFVYVKISLIVAALFAAPVWIWQAWSFVSVGLYRNEKVWVYRFAPLTIALFALGVFFGYRALIPVGLHYLLSFRDPTVIQNWIGLDEYLAFFMTLTLVLGLAFQLPIVVALLLKLEIVDLPMLREKRRHFILGAFILSALLTPPDVVTQVLMAIPLLVLYEFGMFLGWLMMGKDRPSIAWAVWRRRAVFVAVLMVGAWFAQNAVVSGYRGRLVGQKIHRSGDEVGKDAVPYFDVFGQCDFLPENIERAFRLRQLDGEELWVVGTADAAKALRLTFGNDRLNLTERKSEVSRFLLMASTQAIRAELPTEAERGDVAPLLVDALDDAFSNDAVDLDVLLEGWVGRRPEGLAACDADDEGSIDRARSAWRKLIEEESKKPDGESESR